MKIFIVHKGLDVDFAYLLKDVLVRLTDSEVLVLENSGKLWKLEAAKLIKQANLVLVLNGPKTNESPYIGWEISKSINKDKQVFFLDIKKYENIRNRIVEYNNLSEDKKINIIDLLREQDRTTCYGNDSQDVYPLHEALKHRNPFTKEYLLDCRVKEKDSITAVVEAVNKYNSGEYDIYNGAIDSIDDKQLFEQYKLYLATSESLVSRRQSVNTFYITVNSAIITIGSVVCALFGNLSEKAFVIILVAFMGIILDCSWYRILEAYGILNASKMKIVSMIEKNLPVSLYDKEWDVMSDKLNGKRYVSFTDGEKRVPIIFIMLYLIVILIMLILSIVF